MTDNHIKILLAMHSEENHCVRGEDMVRFKMGFRRFDDLFQDLLSEDLVEYEVAENTYYLAYEGFEIVEAWQEAQRPVEPDPGPEYIIAFKTPGDFKRLALGIILAFAVFGGLGLWLNPNIGREKLQEHLDAGQMDELEEELKQIIDSVQNVKVNESLDR